MKGKSYMGSRKGTDGVAPANTSPNPNRSGPNTSVKMGSGQGQGTTGKITHKNPYPNGLS
jgi:hypothetical protein